MSFTNGFMLIPPKVLLPWNKMRLATMVVPMATGNGRVNISIRTYIGITIAWLKCYSVVFLYNIIVWYYYAIFLGEHGEWITLKCRDHSYIVH